MSICLGIDPDSKYIALAAGSSHGVLDVYSHKVKKAGKDDLESMIKALGHHIPAFMKSLRLDPVWPLRIVIEGQLIYPSSKEQPNDLLKLARIAGAAAGVCSMLYPDKKIIIPKPYEWKGTVPKPVHQARLFHKLGWGYKKTRGYAYPLKPAVGKYLNQSEWKHVADAIGLMQWGAGLDIT